MKVIGLTGGIASGKSTVSSMFRELGAAVIDADEIARKVTAKGGPAWKKIVQYFGEEYLQPNGEINRSKLGSLVFSNPSALSDLNSITHPYIRKCIQNELKRLEKEGKYQVVIVDAALLIEAGWSNIVSEVWLVTVEPDLQLSRLMARNKLSRDDAMERIKSQMAQDQKKKYATRVIDNSFDIENTRKQVEAIWKELNAVEE